MQRNGVLGSGGIQAARQRQGHSDSDVKTSRQADKQAAEQATAFYGCVRSGVRFKCRLLDTAVQQATTGSRCNAQ